MAGTVVASTINNDTGIFSTNNAYLGIAKAWVNFVGSTAAINGSFNISSITRNQAGKYTISFTTAMPNVNYGVIGSTSGTGSSASIGVITNSTSTTGVSDWASAANATGSFQITTPATSTTPSDMGFVNVAVFSS